MKVLIISPNSSFGGAATANMNIAHMMNLAGLEVVYNDEFLKPTPQVSFEISDFPVYGNLKNKKALVDYIKAGNYDYVLVGDNRVLIHYFYQFLILKKSGKRIGVIFHSLNIGKNLRNRITDWLVSIATTCANDLLYVSKYTQDSWNNFLVIRSTKRKGKVIYNAVQSVELNIGPIVSKPNIVFVGRLSPEKRPDLFCKIAEKYHQKYNFIIWGDGPLYHDLCNQYKAYVTFMGYGNDIDKIYHDVSLIVVPSVLENCPMCVLESMVRGIPCICTKVGGIPEIVISGVNGEFLDANDFIKSFELCAQKVFDDYDTYRTNCSKLSQSYTFEALSKEWTNLINKVQ